MVWRGGVVLVVAAVCGGGAWRPLEVAWCVGGGVAVCGVWWWYWCGGIGGVELVVVRCGVGVLWVWCGGIGGVGVAWWNWCGVGVVWVRSGGVEELVWCVGGTELVWWEWRGAVRCGRSSDTISLHGRDPPHVSKRPGYTNPWALAF